MRLHKKIEQPEADAHVCVHMRTDLRAHICPHMRTYLHSHTPSKLHTSVLVAVDAWSRCASAHMHAQELSAALAAYKKGLAVRRHLLVAERAAAAQVQQAAAEERLQGVIAQCAAVQCAAAPSATGQSTATQRVGSRAPEACHTQSDHAQPGDDDAQPAGDDTQPGHQGVHVGAEGMRFMAQGEACKVCGACARLARVHGAQQPVMA